MKKKVPVDFGFDVKPCSKCNKVDRDIADKLWFDLQDTEEDLNDLKKIIERIILEFKDRYNVVGKKDGYEYTDNFVYQLESEIKSVLGRKRHGR